MYLSETINYGKLSIVKVAAWPRRAYELRIIATIRITIDEF